LHRCNNSTLDFASSTIGQVRKQAGVDLQSHPHDPKIVLGMDPRLILCKLHQHWPAPTSLCPKMKDVLCTHAETWILKVIARVLNGAHGQFIQPLAEKVTENLAADIVCCLRAMQDDAPQEEWFPKRVCVCVETMDC
jgi:hypothetical protein